MLSTMSDQLAFFGPVESLVSTGQVFMEASVGSVAYSACRSARPQGRLAKVRRSQSQVGRQGATLVPLPGRYPAFSKHPQSGRLPLSCSQSTFGRRRTAAAREAQVRTHGMHDPVLLRGSRLARLLLILLLAGCA